jgi:heme/copper-type cytochrome/quinol oxidase subunit 3
VLAARARALVAYRLGAAAAGILAAVHGGLIIADWLRTPFTVDEHAYGSLFYVVPGFHLSLVGIGLFMVVVLFLLSWHEEATAMLHIGTRSLTLYWYVTVVGGLGILAVVYLIPHFWPVAISPAGAGP